MDNLEYIELLSGWSDRTERVKTTP